MAKFAIKRVNNYSKLILNKKLLVSTQQKFLYVKNCPWRWLRTAEHMRNRTVDDINAWILPHAQLAGNNTSLHTYGTQYIDAINS